MNELEKKDNINTLETHLNSIQIPYRDKEGIETVYNSIRNKLTSLLRSIQKKLHEQSELEKKLNEQSDLLLQPFRIFVAGEFSKGKSFLINVLCGNETVRETNLGPQDTKITVLAHGDPRDNTFSKYIDVKHYPFEFLKICNLVDSPGINAVLRPEHTRITRENIASANLVLFVTSAERTISNEEIELIRFISENNNSEIVFILNKTDVFEDSLISFVDNEGMKTINRFLEQTLLKETHVKDPFIFPVSTRRAMWAIINNNIEVWERSGVPKLINYIGDIIKSGNAAILKLRSPLNFINGQHIDGLPILQGLLEKEEQLSMSMEKSKKVIRQVEDDIKQHMVEIHDAINSFNLSEVERSFEKSLDLFIERFMSKENLKTFKHMTKEEQEKYVRNELNDAFKDWEKGIDEKKLVYIDDILRRFEHCWNNCRKTLQQEKDSNLTTLIEDRERREGKTLEESFNFEKQNLELVKRFTLLKDEIKSGNQKAFQDQVLNTHNTIEKNSTIWTAVSATSLAGAFTGVIVDLFVTGGIISLLSILGGGAGALGAFALRDQKVKKIKDEMQKGMDKTFEAFRISFNEKIRDVFHEEADSFEVRCRRTFVSRLFEITDEKLAYSKSEQEELKGLLSQSVNIEREISELAKLIR